MKITNKQFNLPLQGNKNTVSLTIELTDFEATFIKWLSLQPDCKCEYNSEGDNSNFPFSINDIYEIEDDLIRYGVIFKPVASYTLNGNLKEEYQLKTNNESESLLNTSNMRSFTDEELKEYNKSLDNIFKPTGRKFFDKVDAPISKINLLESQEDFDKIEETMCSVICENDKCQSTQGVSCKECLRSASQQIFDNNIEREE